LRSLSFLFLIVSAAFAAPSLDPPKLRLDGSATLRNYAVDLTIVPDRDTFRGASTLASMFARRPK
jgi:hypothetical protein